MRTAKGKRCVKEVIPFAVAQKPVSRSLLSENVSPRRMRPRNPKKERRAPERRAEKSFPLRAAQWMRIARRGLFVSAEMVEQDSVRPYLRWGVAGPMRSVVPGKSAKGLRFVHAT